MLHIIDSKTRSSGIVSDFTTTFALPQIRVGAIELAEVEVPFSYRTVRTGNLGLCKLAGQQIVVHDGLQKVRITSANNTLTTDFDGQVFTATLTPGDYSPTDFCTTLQSALAADPLTSSVTIALLGKIKITIKRVPHYTRGGIRASSPLVSVLGLTFSPATQDQKTNYLAELILMNKNENVYEITSDKDVEFYTYDLAAEFAYYQSQILAEQSATISITVVNHKVTLSAATPITVNITDQSQQIDFFAYELGFRSNKSGTTVTADQDLKYPFHYSIKYDNSFTVSYSDLGNVTFTIPDGNYTIYDLCATMKTQIIAANPAITNASVTYDRHTWRISISITANTIATTATLQHTPTPTYLAAPLYLSTPTTLSSRLGLSGNITANISAQTVVFTFQGPPNLSGPDAIYLRSSIAKQYGAMGFYKSDDVIIRIPIQVGPNQTIIYRPENEPKLLLYEDSYITSISAQLTYEDGQLVDLGGQDWSFNLRIS